VILITDRELTPLTGLATIQLVVRSEGLSMFDSNCSRLAVIEALVLAMIRQLEAQIQNRAEVCESLFESFSTFVPWAGGIPRSKSYKALVLGEKKHNTK
jgi:DNA-binding MurR/RpiR family transcriptional regulator